MKTFVTTAAWDSKYVPVLGQFVLSAIDKYGKDMVFCTGPFDRHSSVALALIESGTRPVILMPFPPRGFMDRFTAYIDGGSVDISSTGRLQESLVRNAIKFADNVILLGPDDDEFAEEAVASGKPIHVSRTGG